MNFASGLVEDSLVPLRALVEQACVGSRMGLDFPTEHVAVVERFVRRLAPLLGARLDVVLPAAILHDIAAIEDFSQVARHHELGAIRALAILREHDAADGILEPVAECIRKHVSPVTIGAAPPEVVCLSHADALAQLANPAYWLYYSHTVRGLSFRDGRQWYESLVRTRWAQFDPSLREHARPHYLRALAACADDTTATSDS